VLKDQARELKPEHTLYLVREEEEEEELEGGSRTGFWGGGGCSKFPYCIRGNEKCLLNHDLFLLGSIIRTKIHMLLEKPILRTIKKSKAVPLHAMEALVGRGGIGPTHSRPRH
jgi:hypothetical protein